MKRDCKSALVKLRAGQPLYRGYVLSRSGGRNYFISHALPEELVLARIEEEKRDYVLANAVEILEPSNDRTSPRCPHFKICGGCHYQHIEYPRQISLKESILLDCLKRLGKIETPLHKPLYDRQWHYRYRASFKITKGMIGFYRAKSRDIQEIERCLLVHERISDLLAFIRAQITTGFSGSLEIAGVDPPIVTLLPEEDTEISTIVNIQNKLNKSDVDCVAIYPKSKHHSTEKFISLCLNDAPYKISPRVFFQTNWELNKRVLLLLRENIHLRGKKVVDLYSGAGNFSFALADNAERITGYEENPKAVSNAKINARLRGVSNCEFFCSRAEDIPVKNFDIAVVNPPRAGLTKRAMDKLISLQTQQIIYLSCDPATFSRDLGKLKTLYDIESVRLVDFFPQTFHIESLGVLRKRAASAKKIS